MIRRQRAFFRIRATVVNVCLTAARRDLDEDRGVPVAALDGQRVRPLHSGVAGAVRAELGMGLALHEAVLERGFPVSFGVLERLYAGVFGNRLAVDLSVGNRPDHSLGHAELIIGVHDIDFRVHTLRFGEIGERRLGDSVLQFGHDDRRKFGSFGDSRRPLGCI